MFEDEAVRLEIDRLYGRLLSEKKIDRIVEQKDTSKDWHRIDLNTLKNKDVREVGAEWMTYQAIRELDIESYLASRGWDADNIGLAMTHLVSRAVYPASEHETVRFIRENSSVCELTGYPNGGCGSLQSLCGQQSPL